MSRVMDFVKNCVFCNLIVKKECTFFFENESYVVINDIKPAATHHYLVLPKQHITNPSALTNSDTALVKEMIEIGKNVLQENNGDCDDSRFGFHWPPFNSINHLHLHVISPLSELSFISRAIFWPNSYWFMTVDRFLERLEKKNG